MESSFTIGEKEYLIKTAPDGIVVTSISVITYENRYMYAALAAFLLFIAFSFYDHIMDWVDALRGIRKMGTRANSGGGFLELMGFSKKNMVRGIVQIGLLLVVVGAFALNRMMVNRAPVSESDIKMLRDNTEFRNRYVILKSA